jgi:hypothetical protein
MNSSDRIAATFCLRNISINTLRKGDSDDDDDDDDDNSNNNNILRLNTLFTAISCMFRVV